MKRLIPEKGNETKNSQYMVILHTEDGGTEWVDTLSKSNTKATVTPYIKNDAVMERWKKINTKRIRTRPQHKYGPEVWTSQKFKDVVALQLKRAYDKSVCNHIKQVRDDNTDTKSDRSSSKNV